MTAHAPHTCTVIDTETTVLGIRSLHRCKTCGRKGWRYDQRLNGRAMVCDGNGLYRETPGMVGRSGAGSESRAEA